MSRCLSSLVFCFVVIFFISCGQNASYSLKSATGGETKIFFSLVEKNVRVNNLARIPTSTQVVLATLNPVPDTTHSLELTIPNGYILHVVEPLTEEAVPNELIRFEGFAILATPQSDIKGEGLRSLTLSDRYLYILAVPTEERAPIREDDNIDLSQVVNATPAINLGPRTIDLEFVKARLTELTGDKSIIIDGVEQKIKERGSSNGRNLTRKLLVQEFSKLGFTAVQKPYSRNTAGESRAGTNVIAEKKGTDPTKFILITAHFDDADNQGADDNGSGTAALIAIAKAIKDVNFKYNIRIAGFDQEEDGLIGSNAYAEQLATSGELSGLIGVYNMDMIGYDKNNDGKLAVTDCNENTSAKLSQLVYDAIKRHNIRLQGYYSCSTASDHASFWDKNKPALMLIEDRKEFNPAYHSNNDKLDLINFELLSNTASAVMRVLVDNFGI